MGRRQLYLELAMTIRADTSRSALPLGGRDDDHRGAYSPWGLTYAARAVYCVGDG